MNEVPNLNTPRRPIIGRFVSWLLSPRIMRRILISFAVIITVIAIIYMRVNHRGDRLLENSRRELTAKGENLDWAAYVPAPVPDDENIFKAPNMAEWFNDNRTVFTLPLDHPITNDFARSLENPDSTKEITNSPDAARYLAWSDQFQADFESIAMALKRPYARTVSDYSQPLSMQFPSLPTCAAVTRTLEQRAKCHLLLGQPEKAWQELTLLLDLRRLVERQGKFITTEGDWMVRQDIDHSLAIIARGMETHAWTDAQLIAVESQLRDTDSIARFVDALRCGRAGLLAAFESGAYRKAASMSVSNRDRLERLTTAIVIALMPRGVFSGGFADVLRHDQGMIDVLCPSNGVIHPGEAEQAFSQWKRAQQGLPNLLRDQTWVNEGQVACALERYRLAHGEYPDNLESLLPAFIAQLPHDIINGEPLKYRRTQNGSFLLYSVGWNETDDGGKSVLNSHGAADARRGDWVWNDISKQE